MGLVPVNPLQATSVVCQNPDPDVEFRVTYLAGIRPNAEGTHTNRTRGECGPNRQATDYHTADR